MPQINLSTSDWIQVCILLAIIFYTWETRKLRKWQQKQVQITILNTEMERRGKDALVPSYYPTAVLKIYRDGTFDPNLMFSPGHRLPPTFWERVGKWFKSFCKN